MTAFVTAVTTGVTNTARCRIRDIQVGRFRITFERAGLGRPGGTPGEAESSVGKGASEVTYSNGRGDRSYTDRGDLNAPFRLECVLTGRKW